METINLFKNVIQAENYIFRKILNKIFTTSYSYKHVRFLNKNISAFYLDI